MGAGRGTRTEPDAGQSSGSANPAATRSSPDRSDPCNRCMIWVGCLAISPAPRTLAVGGSIAALAYCKRVGPSRVRRALRIEWQIAIAQWRNHSSAGLFKGARSQLEQARRSLIILREQEREELQRLERFLEPRQHKAFLDGFDIEKALFIEVTRANVVLLAARGVRSAGDVRRRAKEVSKILSLAGERELRAWVNQCAVNFKFDKRDPVYLADAARIETKYRQKRHQFLEELRRGPALLSAKRDQVANARARAEDVLRRKHEHIRKRRQEEKQ